jgi:uncharacterized membrane protein
LLAAFGPLLLCGCVAGLAAGTVAGAVARGAGTPDTPEQAGPLFHGYGTDPRWAVDIFEDQMFFYSEAASFAVATPTSLHTIDSHRYETGRLVIEIRHETCRPGSYNYEYPLTIAVVVDGEELHGCGVERPHE